MKYETVLFRALNMVNRDISILRTVNVQGTHKNIFQKYYFVYGANVS